MFRDMTNTTDYKPREVVNFFAPEDMAGKWHAKRMVTGEADCGKPVLLGSESIEATKQDLDNGTQHPIICGLCRRLHRSGRTSLGVY